MFFHPIFDPLYFVFVMPPLLLGLWAQFRVKSAFNKYSQVRTQSGISGAEAAKRILQRGGIGNVSIESAQGGMLSDHYDPRQKVLRLSDDVYRLPSIAAVGVAAHEAGHALQDKGGYMPLQLRSFMVPAVTIGGNIGPLLFIAGMFLAGTLGTTLAWAGIILFGSTALFALVTLPVELDASRRAKELLVSQGIVSSAEMAGVNAVLDAAALTYVAFAAQMIMQLFYYLTIMNRRNS